MTDLDQAALQQAQDRQRRRRERLIIGVVLVLIVTITFLEVRLVRRGGEPIAGSILAFGLVNLNTILLLLLTFLIFRNLVKLFLERRRQIFGSRLRSRLVVTFVTLSLLPTLFMSFVAFQFISNRTEYQLNTQVEMSLTNSLALSQTFLQGMERKVEVIGQIISKEIQDRRLLAPGEKPTLADLVTQSADEYHLNGVEIFLRSGERWVASDQDSAMAVSTTPEIFQELLGQGAHKTFSKKEERGEILRSVTPIVGGGSLDMPAAYLVVSQLIPGPVINQIDAVKRGVADLRHLQLLLHPVRVGHYLALGVVTLLVIMSAIWLAIYMAKEITTPIRQLSEGTVKVADGDYTIHIASQGLDEIGFLVQSFNKMTQELQQSRAHLDAASRQLFEQNQELEQRRKYMEIVLRNVAAGVISLDAEGQITTVNTAAAHMLGINPWESVGRDFRQIWPARQYDKINEIMDEAVHSFRGSIEKPVQIDLKNKTLSLLVKPTVLRDEQKDSHGMVVVLEDLTELERAQRLAAWREVARRIAHEVKNPLTPIQLAAQRLWRRYAEQMGEEGQVLRDCTQMIITQVDGLKNLVNEFSQFARLPHVTPVPIDFNELVRESLVLYQDVGPHLTLEFSPDERLGPVMVDGQQFKRVLLNLIDNAITSVSGKGSISLETKLEETTERVRLTVTDTGSGIPDRDKPRVFEPYFSTKKSGTGLGLAISRAIIAEHRGAIWVEDNQPQGSRFIIELPLRN